MVKKREKVTEVFLRLDWSAVPFGTAELQNT